MQHCFLFNFDIILIKNFIGISLTSLVGMGVSPRVGEGSGADPEFKRKGVHQEIINGEQTAPTSTNMQDPLSSFYLHFWEKVNFRSQILECPSIGQYWNIFGRTSIDRKCDPYVL